MFVAFDDKLACTLRNVHSGVPKSTLSMHINVLLRVDPSLTIPMHPRTINERLLAASSSVNGMMMQKVAFSERPTGDRKPTDGPKIFAARGGKARFPAFVT